MTPRRRPANYASLTPNQVKGLIVDGTYDAQSSTLAAWRRERRMRARIDAKLAMVRPGPNAAA